MAYENIILEKGRGIATITLNRPDRLNAFTDLMFEELFDAFEAVGQDDEIRVVVITGAGKAFSAGADVRDRFKKQIQDRKRGTEDRTGKWVLLGPSGRGRLKDMPKPIIAAINGPAVGFGCALTLNCDIRIASEEARMGLAYIRMGLMPDSGSTYFLLRLVGLAKACELIYTGKTIDAREAKEIGLVNQVVPAEELNKVTYELAETIANNPPIAIRLAKRGLYQSLNGDLPTQIEFENFANSFLFKTEDHEEAVNAYLEKRPAVFKGR